MQKLILTAKETPDYCREGREAYARHAWSDAYHAFFRADQARGLEAADLERLATAAYLIGRELDFQRFTERLYRRYMDAGNPERAARCAFWDGDRVAGIKGHSRAGGVVEERARMVIGADGVHSTVAKAVQAPEYDTKPPLTTNYYAYFSAFPAGDLEQYVRDYHAVGCFPTHDGLTLVAVLWPSGRFEEIRGDIEGHFAKALELAPSVAERMRHARRETKWFGTAGVPNYFRRPYGPGWALAGDAGYDKDPITAQGISDAFLDAEALASALDDGWSGRRSLEAALAEYQSRRDQRAKPLYDFTCQLATLEPPPPMMQRLFAAMRDDQDATNGFFSAITGSTPLPSFLNPENVERIVAGSRSM